SNASSGRAGNSHADSSEGRSVRRRHDQHALAVGAADLLAHQFGRGTEFPPALGAIDQELLRQRSGHGRRGSGRGGGPGVRGGSRFLNVDGDGVERQLVEVLSHPPRRLPVERALGVEEGGWKEVRSWARAKSSAVASLGVAQSPKLPRGGTI